MCASCHCACILRKSLFGILLITALPACPCMFSSWLPTWLLLSSPQQQQVSHVCACKAAKYAWPATVCGAAAKTHAPAVLLIKSTACSTTWRMVAAHHACLQLIRIGEASSVQIHVKAFAAASFVVTTYNSTNALCTIKCYNAQSPHTLPHRLIFVCTLRCQTTTQECHITILLLLNVVCIQ